MAGRRHHHIWQFLQRGFSWREHGDDQIWVYRIGTEPKQTVTRKFGRLAEFYGPEDSAADANITAFEGQVQSFLQEVRQLKDGIELESVLVAPIVAHLEMRTLFLRSEISRVCERIFSGIGAHFNSQSKIERLVGEYLRRNPKTVDEQLDKFSVNAQERKMILELVSVNMPAAIAESAEDMATIINPMFEGIRASLTELAKSAHIKSLEGDFTEIERARGYEPMRFRVLRLTDGGLILPDTSLAFFKKNGLTPLSQKSDEIESVVLPISREVAIFGWYGNQRVPDIQTLQRALASCSYEAFIAGERSVSLLGLTGRISKNAKLISDAELQKLVSIKSLLDGL